MTTLLILLAAVGLIAVQPVIMRAFPSLRERQRRPWVDYFSPEAIAERWQEPPPKKESALTRWWNTPSPLENYNNALKTYTQVTPRLLENATQLLDRLRADHFGEACRTVVEQAADPPSEIYIDGTTGKRIVPAHLSEYDREQQLQGMNRQIAQHDQLMA